jgi:hypothetical protein
MDIANHVEAVAGAGKLEVQWHRRRRDLALFKKLLTT